MNSDLDSVRYREAIEAAQTLVTSPRISNGTTPYVDIFAQQIVNHRSTGAARIDSRSIPPPVITTESALLEGVALRRLGYETTFVVQHGLEPESITSLNRSESTEIAPVPFTTPAPHDEGLKNEMLQFIRVTMDSVLSVVDSCRMFNATLSTVRSRKFVGNSLGVAADMREARIECHVEIETPAGTLSVTRTHWSVDDGIPFDAATLTADLALAADRRRSAAPLKLNTAPLLLPPGWGGVWMHEAVGHLLEADTAIAGNSSMYERMGDCVSYPHLSIVDDGTLNPSRVTSRIDDEGTPTQRTVLIKSGVVTGLLTDRATANSLGVACSGNGRRAHYGLPPRPRMTNLLLLPGPDSYESLLNAAPLVIEVRQIRHAWIDSVQNRLFLEISDASLIRNGHEVEALLPFVASASPLELLRSVIGVGNNIEIDLHRGYCSKDGANLPVTVGQPSILLENMSFT